MRFKRRELGEFPEVDGKVCQIIYLDGTFVLISHGSRREDTNPRWLSDSALASGALRVHWDFDLKLAEG